MDFISVALTRDLAAGDDRGHEDGKALALALEGGHPPLRAERHARPEQRAVKRVHPRLVVLGVFHPRDLLHQKTVWWKSYGVAQGPLNSFTPLLERDASDSPLTSTR